MQYASSFAPNRIDAYRRTEVESRTPLELVVMLYDGALRFVGEARSAIERRDVAARRTAVTRALAIVSELQSTLNMEQGGEISTSLDQLYSFVTTQLMDASFKQDARPLDAATRVLTTLREGWTSISTSGTERAAGTPTMTDTDLSQLLEQYRAGLDAEIVILRRLEATAARQRDASARHDLDALNAAADERDRLMTALVTIEGEVRVVRQTLALSREHARRMPGYQTAVDLHREALGLVSGILQSDQECVEALAAAELARRDLARAIEQGETTLAAYRRVMAAPAGATLVDRRG